MSPIGIIDASGNTSGSLAAASQINNQQKGADASSQQVNTASGSVSATSVAAPTAAQTASPPGTDYSPAYKVEISEAGASLSATAADGASTGAAAQASASAASGAANGSVDGDSDSESSASTNLAVYSDYQLQQMLANGEITQSEYNVEVAKREAQKQVEDANAAGQTNAGVVSEVK